MPRPKKWRKVCCLPQSNEFRPVKCGGGQAQAVVLSVDEYETIRLIDHEGFPRRNVPDIWAWPEQRYRKSTATHEKNFRCVGRGEAAHDFGRRIPAVRRRRGKLPLRRV